MTFSYKTWVNGVDVANAANLQRYDDWIRQTEGGAGSIVVNGSTSGTATAYQVFQGTYKKVLVIMNNFRNGGGSAQNLVLPIAFTTEFEARLYDFHPFSFVHSGSGITFYYLSGISSSGFSTTGVVNLTATNVFGHALSALDTIAFAASQGSAYTGMIIIEGV